MPPPLWGTTFCHKNAKLRGNRGYCQEAAWLTEPSVPETAVSWLSGTQLAHADQRTDFRQESRLPFRIIVGGSQHTRQI